MKRIGAKCDDCNKDCRQCPTLQAAADLEHDRLREAGYWSSADLYWVEQQEEKARRMNGYD